VKRLLDQQVAAAVPFLPPRGGDAADVLHGELAIMPESRMAVDAAARGTQNRGIPCV